jgi:hypothetical protein
MLDGQVVCVAYPDTDASPLGGDRRLADQTHGTHRPPDVQERRLQEVATGLRALGLQVRYTSMGGSAHKPVVEVTAGSPDQGTPPTSAAGDGNHDAVPAPRDRDNAVDTARGRTPFPLARRATTGGDPMADELLEMQLEQAAREGIAYLREALRTGEFQPELLQVAQFLLTTKLQHDDQDVDEFFDLDDEDGEDDS